MSQSPVSISFIYSDIVLERNRMTEINLERLYIFAPKCETHLVNMILLSPEDLMGRSELYKTTKLLFLHPYCSVFKLVSTRKTQF